jgi:hypothetical protein
MAESAAAPGAPTPNEGIRYANAESGGVDPNAVYALGSSSGESARLQRQCDELAPDSVALLEHIGLRAGDSAIDIGCGPRGSSTCWPSASYRVAVSLVSIATRHMSRWRPSW